MTRDVAQLECGNGLSDLTIEVASEDGHKEAEDLRQAALTAFQQDRSVTLNFGGVDHLDTAALQVLLSFEREQRNRKLDSHFALVSGSLHKCFKFAGAIEHLFHDGAVQ